jgi:hypothetical protein
MYAESETVVVSTLCKQILFLELKRNAYQTAPMEEQGTTNSKQLFVYKVLGLFEASTLQ